MLPLQAAAVAAALSCGLLMCSTPAPAWAQDLGSISGAARVVDGDTIRVQERPGQEAKIRMFGIDAPEKLQSCKDGAGRDYNCGQVSTKALQDKIGSSTVRCNVVARDRYGRSVSICFLDGNKEDINQWMVENGHAVAYRQYSKDYIPAEDVARTAKRGIWQGTFQLPADFRRQQREGSATNSAVPASIDSIDLEDIMAELFGAPAGCVDPQIKGNISAGGEKIYHVPEGRSYKAVRIEPEKGEKFFCTVKEAEQAGWRKSLV